MVGWACLGPVAFVDVINSRMTLLDLPASHVAAWSALYLVTGVALWTATWQEATHRRRLVSWWVFAIASALAMQIFTAGGNLGGFAIMSAGLAASVMRTGPLTFAIAAQSALLLVALHRDLSWSGSIFLTLVFVVFQGFTALLVHISQQEYDLRQALASSHADLRFTQALLTHAVTDAERRRISRELHDGLGHQLTVLSLELELANAVSDDTARLESLDRARQLTRNAIALSRETVQELRVSDWEDLQRVQRAVSASAPHLRLNLNLPEPLPQLPAPLIHLSLRFLQETLSNTIKYASATAYEFHLDCSDGTLSLSATDDGVIRNLSKAQNGFRSLRERVEAMGGHFQVRLAKLEPVQLSASVPLPSPRGSN